MTDQDPTQRYEPPAATPAPAGAPAFAPPAAPDVARGAGDPVTTTPVAATSRLARRRQPAPLARRRGARARRRGVAAAATMLLTGDSGDPAVLAWAPADSLAYTELRLDLPGDPAGGARRGHDRLPGLRRPGRVPDQAQRGARPARRSRRPTASSRGRQDIEPWFGGQLSVSVGPLPASIDDVPAAARGARARRASPTPRRPRPGPTGSSTSGDSHATTTTETYNGTTITTVTPAASGDAKAMVPEEAALRRRRAGARRGRRRVGQGRDRHQRHEGARHGRAVPGRRDDRDRRPPRAVAMSTPPGLVDGVEALAGDAGASLMPDAARRGQPSSPGPSAPSASQDGAFIIESRTPHLEALGPADPTEHDARVALLPPTTVFLAEGHDVGETLTMVKDAGRHGARDRRGPRPARPGAPDRAAAGRRHRLDGRGRHRRHPRRRAGRRRDRHHAHRRGRRGAAVHQAARPHRRSPAARPGSR